jgi:hypothetical protein
LYPNDIVVGHYYDVKKIKELINGTLVLVLVSGKLILRRIYVLKDKIVLRADHTNIEDKEYEIKDVKELWKIKYSFLKRVPEFKDDLENQISLLASELNKIKKQLK